MKKKLQYKYLFVTADEYPVYRPEIRVLIGKHLREKGHKIDFLMRSSIEDAPNGKIDWAGFNIWVAQTSQGTKRTDKLRKHIYGLRNELRIFSLIRQNDYDFVQVKDKFLAAIMSLLATFGKRTKFFYWLSFPYPEASLLKARSPDSQYPYFYLFRGWIFDFLLYRIICPLADHIIVQSEEMKKQMAIRGVDFNKMLALPMGVDSNILSIESLDRSQPSATVVYIGALNRLRKLEFLLEVFALVLVKNPDVELVIVGDSEDPTDRAFLEQEVLRLEISKWVRFTGFLQQTETLDIVSKASVCVSPIPPGPVFDVSSPTKTLEYMALGRPVVANDIPDTKYVIEKSGGGLCTAYDVGAFSDAIQWALNNPDRAEAMGTLGKQYIQENRTYEVLANSLQKSYDDFFGQS